MKKIDFNFIPPHFNCDSCGGCCGPVPIDDKEYKEIKEYCIKNKVKPILYLDYTCPFRDEKAKKCMIYEVRPMICKLFGVAEGMTCKNGNSCNINGYKLNNKKKDITGMSKLVEFLLEEE